MISQPLSITELAWTLQKKKEQISFISYSVNIWKFFVTLYIMSTVTHQTLENTKKQQQTKNNFIHCIVTYSLNDVLVLIVDLEKPSTIA